MAMDLEPLADPADLSTRLGVPEDDKLLLWCLDQVSARFRGETGNPVTLTEGDTITLDGNGCRSVLLPVATIVGPVTVTEGGTALVERVDFELSRRNGILRKLRGVWRDSLENIVVVCSHGFQSVPDEVRALILNEAATLHGMTPGVQAMTVEAESVTWSAAALGASSEWTRLVQRYTISGERAG